MKKRLYFLLMLALSLFAGAGLIAEEAATAAAAAVSAPPASYAKPELDFVWLLIAAALVFFMQAGFALVETGLTRAKNAGNIIMKNLMDFCLGSLAFLFIGWGLMYGADVSGLIGFSDFGLTSATPTLPGAVKGVIDNAGMFKYVEWFFQVVFAATAATIVSGAMAERTKFVAYLIYSFVISAVIYPVSGHWLWGQGWLFKLGFHDFAGSTLVHSLGGWSAFMGALILGPRLGKYGPDGRPRAIQGHNIPLAALGVFILWFGWYGFNPGSTLTATGATGMAIGYVAVNTTVAAAAGAIAAMFVIWLKSGKPDVSMTLNGALAGLVAITAGCASVSPTSAVLIGTIGGILVVFAVQFFEFVVKVDDPVGAVSVHAVNGAWGTLAVGLFAQEGFKAGAGYNGLFFGGGFSHVWTQLIGIGAIFAWAVLTTGILFFIIKKTIGLRVSREEELKGLDIEEHGMESYSGFQIFRNM